MMYRVFTRVWWRANREWPNGLEPHIGRKYTIGWECDEKSARALAREWNRNNEPGRFSRKAEYEKV